MEQSLLETSAPGLFHALRRLLSPAALQTLTAGYAHVMAVCGADAPEIAREAGASFNPRPARICRILMTDARETRTEVLLTALAALLPDNAEPLPTASLEWARAAHAAASRGEVPDHPVSERIALAIILDELRHLHMTTLDTAERRTVIQRAAAILGGGGTAPENARLREQVAHALRRGRHLIGESDG